MKKRLFLAIACLGTLAGAFAFAVPQFTAATTTTAVMTPSTVLAVSAPDPVRSDPHDIPRVAAQPEPPPTTTPPTTSPPTTVRPRPPTTALKVAAHPSAGGWRQPWACIAHYESGGNPAENTGNGYWGGLQFVPSTWWAYARPLGINIPAYQASIDQQEEVADRVLAAGGWGQWPNTSRACGYR